MLQKVKRKKMERNEEREKVKKIVGKNGKEKREYIYEYEKGGQN